MYDPFQSLTRVLLGHARVAYQTEILEIGRCDLKSKWNNKKKI